MKKHKILDAPKSDSNAVKQPDKQADNKALQTYTRQQIKEIVFKMTTTGSVEPALNKLADGLLSKWRQGSPKERHKVEKEFMEQVSAVMYGFEADTHIALMEGFGERYRGGAKEMCRQFINDFDCKTAAEKILAESAAIAFMRYLDGSRRLNGCMDVSEYISDERTRYLGYLSKQMDRSHRQYLSSISMIKQLKAPAIEMNIKTKNAFVAQHQQINAPQAPNENNEPK